MRAFDFYIFIAVVGLVVSLGVGLVDARRQTRDLESRAARLERQIRLIHAEAAWEIYTRETGEAE